MSDRNLPVYRRDGVIQYVIKMYCRAPLSFFELLVNCTEKGENFSVNLLTINRQRCILTIDVSTPPF